jgi:hypothetical protein
MRIGEFLGVRSFAPTLTPLHKWFNGASLGVDKTLDVVSPVTVPLSDIDP